MLLVALATTVKAENLRVESPTDFWFQFTKPTLFEARTYQVSGVFSDPMLWFYDGDGNLITANDDWFGLQSFLSVQVQPGWYRLRAGVCCWNPDAWRQGMLYEFGSTVQPAPTTTSLLVESTTSTVETWPTTTTTFPETTTSIVPPSTGYVTSLPPTSSLLPSSTSSSTTSTLETTSTTSLPESTLPSETSSTSSSSTSMAPMTTLVSTGTSVGTTSTVSTSPPRTVPTVPSSLLTTTSAASAPTSAPETTSSAAPTTTTLPFSRPVEPPVEGVAELLEATTPEALTEAVAAIAENLDTLTATELEAIAQAVSNAPVEVKREFEEQVNIFGGGLDSYIPADSNVNVGQRRALIAVGAVLTAAPIVAARRK